MVKYFCRGDVAMVFRYIVHGQYSDNVVSLMSQVIRHRCMVLEGKIGSDEKVQVNICTYFIIHIQKQNNS